ncbi:MAG: LL-diaminopimelate aminotransferase [Oscillospiraceae bacterium]|nr:LL-diaminopimelate aminotransferase [Oscillospiraceae bacterium]
MANINSNFLNLENRYLFTEIERRKKLFMKENPDKDLIDMGVGDVTLPLCDEVIKAMHKAVDEMRCSDTFRGYGPEQGYKFLREKIREDYLEKGVELTTDEIFISDGAGNDLGNLNDILSADNKVLITDPVYPAYADINIMDGRNITFLAASEDNGFVPLPPAEKYDVIYICTPNNPTGAVYSYEQLADWVDYANENGSIIICDSAYESFVREDCPRSIYEIRGAKSCAIEICSYSKTAGFTGIRCGYTVIPKELVRDKVCLCDLWRRRQNSKTNGVSYITQRAAEAIYSNQGKKETRENIDFYLENAEIITKTMKKLGVKYTGGVNSPYIWIKCPETASGWDFFDLALEKANIVVTPGDGFGDNGKGYFRLTAFSTREKTLEAMKRMEKLL